MEEGMEQGEGQRRVDGRRHGVSERKVRYIGMRILSCLQSSPQCVSYSLKLGKRRPDLREDCRHFRLPTHKVAHTFGRPCACAPALSGKAILHHADVALLLRLYAPQASHQTAICVHACMLIPVQVLRR